MAESQTDAVQVVKDIAAGLAFTAILIATIVFTGGISIDGKNLWDVTLQWVTAIPAWIWVTAVFGYLFWLTRTLHEVNKQQKEILQLLRERGGEAK